MRSVSQYDEGNDIDKYNGERYGDKSMIRQKIPKRNNDYSSES